LVLRSFNLVYDSYNLRDKKVVSVPQ
jgi:hypothetical protein